MDRKRGRKNQRERDKTRGKIEIEEAKPFGRFAFYTFDFRKPSNSL